MSVGNSVAGVKNLRAMFETRNSDHSTSPPSRGRSSPNGSITSSSSRPVSKVRSNFVAVERAGDQGSHWGLRKQSDVSSMAEIREEALKVEMTNNDMQVGSSEAGLGAILKGSPFEVLAPQLDGSTGEVEKGLDETKAQATASEESTTNDVVDSTKDDKTDSLLKLKSSKAAPAHLKMQTSVSQPRHSSVVSDKSPGVPKKSLHSPTTPRTNGNTTKARGSVDKTTASCLSTHRSQAKSSVQESKTIRAQADAQQDEKKPSSLNVKPPAVASKPTAASRAHAQKSQPVVQPEEIKSPRSSKHTKLPAAATASTAASAARKGIHPTTEQPRQPSDRRSLQVHAPRVANVSTKASLAKKSSRASMANGAEELAKSRSSAVHKPADEGFLARLTRPTASSSQKAHDKVQVNSPPRSRKSDTARKSVGRKSLNVTLEDYHTAEPPHSSSPHSIRTNGDTSLSTPRKQATEQADEGEPGPAEESEDITNPIMQSQQAEIEVL